VARLRIGFSGCVLLVPRAPEVPIWEGMPVRGAIRLVTRRSMKVALSAVSGQPTPQPIAVPFSALHGHAPKLIADTEDR